MTGVSPAPTDGWLITATPDAADLAQIEAGVLSWGRAQAVGGNARSLAALRYDAVGSLQAGASGRTEFDRLFVGWVWVQEALRGQGLGSAALAHMEAGARARGCTDAVIETLSDRTATLYFRLGYVPLAQIECWVGPFTRHVLRKVIRA